MAEMDIYQRRRLAALGGLVVFFIIFVLLIKSCGGDDEPDAFTPVPSGATGDSGTAALSEEEFIAQADEICAQANSAVGALDPADEQATQDEASITSDELAQLNSLELDGSSTQITRFLGALGDVASALKDKAKAVRQGDVTAADEAQLAIDTAEVEARDVGEQAGFRDCGQFLDAGEAPGGADPADTGAVAPSDSGAVTPPADTTAPPADTGTAPPPADTGTAPPADDGGGGGGVAP